MGEAHLKRLIIQKGSNEKLQIIATDVKFVVQLTFKGKETHINSVCHTPEV